jgi:hypothetical protein
MKSRRNPVLALADFPTLTYFDNLIIKKGKGRNPVLALADFPTNNSQAQNFFGSRCRNPVLALADFPTI